jgi:hypothetical protein
MKPTASGGYFPGCMFCILSLNQFTPNAIRHFTFQTRTGGGVTNAFIKNSDIQLTAEQIRKGGIMSAELYLC